MKSINIVIFSCLFSLVACSFSAPFLYKHDTAQGNIITTSGAEKIVVGMSRNEVHSLIGSPAIVDPFHDNEEIYYFFLKSGDSDRIYSKSMTIKYNKNQNVIDKKETPLQVKK